MPQALVVDDDASSLRALAALIEREGFSTSTATTLESARNELAKAEPDVLLVDLVLPDGSGIEFIKSLEQMAGTDIVMVTGHASVDTAVEALRLGATDYLTKPID